MEQMEKFRRAEALRLIEWISNHHEEWKGNSKNECIRQTIETSILSELKRNWSDELLDRTLDTLLDHVVRV